LILSGVAAGQIGELYVEFDIDFYDPKIPVPLGQNLPMAHIASGAGAATDAAPLTGGAIRAGSTITGLSFTNGTVTIPAVGRYMIGTVSVSAAQTAAPQLTLTTNASAVNIIGANSISGTGGFVLNVSGVRVNVFDVTAPNGVITLTAGTGVVAGNFDVIISQLSSGLTKPKSELESKLEKVDALLALLGEGRALKKDEKSEALPPLSVDSKGNDDDGIVMVPVASAKTGAAVASVAPGSVTRPRKG